MKFAVAALLGSVSAMDLMTDADYQFMAFVNEHGRSFGTVAEYQFRANLFKQNLALVEMHNAKNLSWTLETNFLSDRTADEKKALLGFKEMPTSAESNIVVLSEEGLADSIDWRTKGAVTPVKNQGQCGSCWSFSTTGSMEGAHAIKTGNLVSLSEQNLVDCSWLNHGCNGGMMDLAFKYAESHPLETEESYPYTAKTGLFKCSYDKSKGVVGVTGYSDVTPKSSAQLKAALNKGPVSIAIEADKAVFQQYKSGILTGSACGTSLDHGVLVVGYGADAGQEYYIVKNSWSAAWGDNGYIKLGVESGAGVCGIQSQPSYPATN